MSWHTSAIFILKPNPCDYAALLADLGFPGAKPAGSTNFEDATSSMAHGKSVANVNGWTIICDPMFFVSLTAAEEGDIPMQSGIWSNSLDKALRRQSENRGRVFGFVTEGASGTHGFTWHENGKLGRALLYQAGAILIDQGNPLVAEAEVDGHDWEQRMLALMTHLCVPWDDLDRAVFTQFEN